MKRIEDIINLNRTFNQQNYDNLKEDIKKNKVTPFIGSGMSVPIYKTWKRTLQDIKQVSHLNNTEKLEINRMLNDNNLISCASKLAEYIGEDVFIDKLCSCFDKKNIDNQKLCEMPISILPQIFTQKIITTNYDCILERVYKEIEVRYNIVLKNRVSHVLDEVTRSNLTKPLLIKIHGTIDEEESVVIREEDYCKIYSKELPATNYLMGLIINNSFLFLGCSLSDDKFCDLLKEERKFHQNHHYAIVEIPRTNDEWKKREQVLNSMGISPIWYPLGKHEYIKIILQQLMKDIEIKSDINSNVKNKVIKDNKENKQVTFKTFNELQKTLKREVEEIIDSMFDDFTNAQKLTNCFVPPVLYYDKYVKNIKINLDDLCDEISMERQRSYIIVGNPGLGKTMAISYINRQLLNNNKKVILLTKSTFMYMCNKKKSKLSNTVKNALDRLLKKEGIFKKSRNGVFVLIESMEEIVLNKPNAKRVLQKLIDNGYTVVVGTRNVNLEDTRAMINNEHTCLYLFPWEDDEIKTYVKKRYQEINEKISQLNSFLQRNTSINNLMYNPFYASLISCLFIMKKESEMKTLSNIYLLYNEFYNAWIQREFNKFGNRDDLDKNIVFNIHYYIASNIYENGNIGDIDDILKKFEIKNTLQTKEIIGSILKYDNSNSQIGNKQIVGFFHETFVEFIIVKKVIDTIIYKPTDLKNVFPIDFKHFNIKFFENGIQILKSDEEKKYRIHLESIYYYFLTDDEKANFEKYVSNDVIKCYKTKINQRNIDKKNKLKNSIIYSYGKVRGRILRRNPNFLLYVYENETNIRVKICAALAAIKHKIFLAEIRPGLTYEEDFLNQIKNNELWNEAIRSIALVFWGDERKEDILSYKDDKRSWKETKKRNIKRIYNKDDKSTRTRVLDLTVLYIFYESRNWEDFDLETYQLINKCKFENYPNNPKLINEIKNLFFEKRDLVLTE